MLTLLSSFASARAAFIQTPSEEPGGEEPGGEEPGGEEPGGGEPGGGEPGGEEPGGDTPSGTFANVPWQVPGADFAVGSDDPDTLTPASDLESTDGLTIANDVFTITADEFVLENVDFRHGGVASYAVVVNANDVIIRNCYFQDSAEIVVRQSAGKSGLLIENCTFDGLKEDWITCMVQSFEGALTVRYCHFFDLQEDAIKAKGGLLVEYCHIHSSGYGTGAHADLITVDEGADILIRRNYLDGTTPQDASGDTNNCVRIVAADTEITNPVITENVIVGASYLIAITISGTGVITGAAVTSNFMDDWINGPLYPTGLPDTYTWSDNADLSSGEPIADPAA